MAATDHQPHQQPPPINNNCGINCDEEDHQRLIKGGYVFNPSPELILTSFLKYKNRDATYTHPAIPEINNLYAYHPQELLDGKREDKGAYFYVWRNWEERNQEIRNAKDGYWEIIEEELLIKHPSLNYVKFIGVERTFGFFTGQSPTGTRSEYVMLEYEKLDEKENFTEMDVWVTCHVFKPSDVSEQDIEEYYSTDDE